MTYSIVRFYERENTLGEDRKLIASGLTLEEAKAHCRSDESHGNGWFDGYVEEEDE